MGGLRKSNPASNFIDTSYDEASPDVNGKIHAWEIDATNLLSMNTVIGGNTYVAAWIIASYDAYPYGGGKRNFETPVIFADIKYT